MIVSSLMAMQRACDGCPITLHGSYWWLVDGMIGGTVLVVANGFNHVLTPNPQIAILSGGLGKLEWGPLVDQLGISINGCIMKPSRESLVGSTNQHTIHQQINPTLHSDSFVGLDDKRRVS